MTVQRSDENHSSEKQFERANIEWLLCCSVRKPWRKKHWIIFICL